MVSIAQQRASGAHLGWPAHEPGGQAQRVIDRLKTSGLATGTCDAIRSTLGGIAGLGRPVVVVVVAGLIAIGCAQAEPSAPEQLTTPCVGFAGMGLPYDPDAEPVDPRFPAALNAAVEQMTEAERDALAPTWAEQAAWLEEQFDAQQGPGMFGRSDAEEAAKAQLDFFRQGTDQPNATLDDMYAAALDCQRANLDSALTRFQEDHPDATVADLLEHNWEQMRRMVDEGQGVGLI